MSTHVHAPTPGAVGRQPTLRNVQALRGAAALIVVAAHFSGPDGFESRVFGSDWTWWSNLPANTGVDLFFVISGLIMVVTTWHSFDAPGSARRFLWRRVTRIYPLYWMVNTAIIVLFLLSPGSVRFDEGAQPDILGSYLLLPHDGRLPLLVAWSLVFEMYFYLLFTVALVLPRRWFGWVIGTWAAVTLSLYVALGQVGSGAGTTTSHPFLSLVASPLSLEFVFGVAIGYAVLRGWIVAPRTVLTLGIGLAAVTLGFLASVGWERFPSDIVRVCGPGLVAAVLVYGAVGVELRRGGLFPKSMQWLGDWSYSLYLIHVPVLTLLALVLARLWSPGPVVHAAALVVVPLFVVFCAYVCHSLLERPLQNFFRGVVLRRVRKPVPDRGGARSAG